jgi:internalin A
MDFEKESIVTKSVQHGEFLVSSRTNGTPGRISGTKSTGRGIQSLSLRLYVGPIKDTTAPENQVELVAMRWLWCVVGRRVGVVGRQTAARLALARTPPGGYVAMGFLKNLFGERGPSACKYYERAMTCERKGDHDGALVALDEAIRLDGEYCDAYWMRAMVHELKQDYDKALADLRTALTLKPASMDNFELNYNQEPVRVLRVGPRVSLKDPRALPIMRRGLRKDMARIYREKGMACYDRQEYANAIPHFTEALRHKEECLSFFERGRAYLLVGQFKEAIADLKQAVALANPDEIELTIHAAIHYYLGSSYLETGDFERAVSSLAISIRLEPRVCSYEDRARAYRGLGDARRSADDDRKVRELRGESSQHGSGEEDQARSPGESQQGKGRRGKGAGASRPAPDDEEEVESKYHDDPTSKGIAIVNELCSRDDLSLSQLVGMHRDAVEQLRQAGPEGQNALAQLLRELLASRSASLFHALDVAGELQPHPDLIQAVREICAASPLGPASTKERRTLEKLLAAGPGGGRVGAAGAREKRPGPLPGDVVAAWEKVGAQAGWMWQDKFGQVMFRSGSESKVGDVAAFSMGWWKSGVLSTLPAPEQPFGLDLERTELADAGLKELAGLKQLQALNLMGTNVTDAGLKELTGLKQLQSLDLSYAQVTDRGLKHLAGLKQLQSLNLTQTEVTRAGLKKLSGLKQLQTLSLDSASVTDAELKVLAGLKQLQSLRLQGTKVTDAGLKELAGLKQLQSLNLSNAQMTDAVLKELAALKQLQSLDLSHAQVTDAALKELARLKQLQSLNLSYTQVTDAVLKELVGLNQLQWLNLINTQVTEAGADDLRKALPDCQIFC